MAAVDAAAVPGFIGIDIGTQGLSVLFTDENLKVLATGEGAYGFVTTAAEQEAGCYEQRSSDWLQALQEAMQQIHKQIPTGLKILAIGISGQMHGEVLLDASDQVLGPVRLWCDARNGDEGNELTDKLQIKVPKRATCARFLWTTRHRRSLAQQVRHITTPAGWMAWQLTQEHTLGIGDAAGMFPVDPTTLDYDADRLQQYNALVNDDSILPLGQLLPGIRRAGQDAGNLTAAGAALLGVTLPSDDGPKIPVASAEGDQVAALAGSLIGQSGTISCSFGTSVCANVVVSSDGPAFQGVSPAVDHFCACDGKPIHMVWLRNGTTFLNTIVESYGGCMTAEGDQSPNPFARVMPALIQAPDDCGGLVALPFMDDEPGLGVSEGGSALIMGWKDHNKTHGHVSKAALLSTIFNLKAGCQVLQAQGIVMHEIVLSGGLVKTPECGQIVANVFDLPVALLTAAEEGSSWGACVMAQYRHAVDCSSQEEVEDWATFVDKKRKQKTSNSTTTRFVPNPDAVKTLQASYQRYQQLMQIEPQLRKIMTS